MTSYCYHHISSNKKYFFVTGLIFVFGKNMLLHFLHFRTSFSDQATHIHIQYIFTKLILQG